MYAFVLFIHCQSYLLLLLLLLLELLPLIIIISIRIAAQFQLTPPQAKSVPHFSHRLAIVRTGDSSTSSDNLAVAAVEPHLVPTGTLLLLFRLCARQTPSGVDTAVPFALLISL